jgi:hypothetical protein
VSWQTRLPRVLVGVGTIARVGQVNDGQPNIKKENAGRGWCRALRRRALWVCAGFPEFLTAPAAVFRPYTDGIVPITEAPGFTCMPPDIVMTQTDNLRSGNPGIIAGLVKRNPRCKELSIHRESIRVRPLHNTTGRVIPGFGYVPARMEG